MVTENSIRLRRLDAIAAESSVGADPGHDILHVRRVAQNARQIAAVETADDEIVIAAALLHELFNYPKDHPDKARSGEVCAEAASIVLEKEGYAAGPIEAIAYAIRVHPFSLGILPETLEAKILQDADRLDALGAAGIARVFSTGSALGRPFYADLDPFCASRPPDDSLYTIDHFYRKLLKLPDFMHTTTGHRIARQRAAFLTAFLEQFESEIRPSA